MFCNIDSGLKTKRFVVIFLKQLFAGFTVCMAEYYFITFLQDVVSYYFTLVYFMKQR